MLIWLKNPRKVRHRTFQLRWDPERGLGGPAGREACTHALPDVRSLQMGLRSPATDFYAAEAIARITDVTDLFHSVGVALAAGEIEAAEALLPQEQRYPLPPELPILETSELPEAPRRESAEPPTA